MVLRCVVSHSGSYSGVWSAELRSTLAALRAAPVKISVGFKEGTFARAWDALFTIAQLIRA